MTAPAQQDGRGFFPIPKELLNRLSPQKKFFNVREGAQYVPADSLVAYQINANCDNNEWLASIGGVPGRTVAAAYNVGGNGFHLTGSYPQEPEINFADTITPDPRKCPDYASAIAWLTALSPYVPPNNDGPFTPK